MTSKQVHTIADIARLAGVSKSTVSRALNDSPLIGTETKERIRALAREHHFQMNVPARRLSLKQSHAVALVTSEYNKYDSAVPDSFMLEILSGIASGLHASDYDLLIIQVHSNDTQFAHRYLDTGRADGFILPTTCSQRQLRSLLEMQAPFILWGAPPSDHRYNTVSGDSFTGGRLATEHLLTTGHSRIAFLGGPAHEPEVQDRYRGYEAALRQAGHNIDPALVIHADWEHPDTASVTALLEVLERAPDLDAVFANSDLMAIAAIDTLRDQGRRVPDDVAVVGYDDVAIARHSNPPLTTIRQNGPLIGKLLAQNLIQHLQTGVITNVSIPAELVIRKSA